jgi:hypothetical protein
VEYGLGSATAIDSIVVRWPSSELPDIVVNPPFIDQRIGWIEGDAASIVPAETRTMRGLVLHQNQPNPFNPMTMFHYDLEAPGDVRIRVFDVAGRIVRVVQNPTYTAAGRHTARWDGRDNDGREVASGVYFYRIEAGASTATRPMVLVR